MPSKVCPICGRETDVLIEGMCPSCYSERHRLISVEGPVKLLVCKSCLSAYQRGGRWVRDWKQVARKAVQAAVKFNGSITGVEMDVMGNPLTTMSVRVRARGGKIHESLGEVGGEEAIVPLNVVLDLCPPTCRYVYSEREAAVIQVRKLGGRPIDGGDLRTALESVIRITLAKSE